MLRKYGEDLGYQTSSSTAILLLLKRRLMLVCNIQHQQDLPTTKTYQFGSYGGFGKAAMCLSFNRKVFTGREFYNRLRLMVRNGAYIIMIKPDQYMGTLMGGAHKGAGENHLKDGSNAM